MIADEIRRICKALKEVYPDGNPVELSALAVKLYVREVEEAESVAHRLPETQVEARAETQQA